MLQNSAAAQSVTRATCGAGLCLSFRQVQTRISEYHAKSPSACKPSPAKNACATTQSVTCDTPVAALLFSVRYT